MIHAVTADRWIQRGLFFMCLWGFNAILSVQGGFQKFHGILKKGQTEMGSESLGLGGK